MTATDRQRDLERRIRAAKRVLIVALDDAAERKANARIRALVAELAHLVKSKQLERDRTREQA
jgi:hypothetical protein